MISLFGAYHLHAPYLVVFENASSTSLMDFLAAEENQRCIWQNMYEVALGLSYLHERQIVLGELRCDDTWIGKDGLAMIPGSGLEERDVNSDTSVIQRAKSRKVSLKANVLHREIDGLLALLNTDDIDPVHIWTPDLVATVVKTLGAVNESPEEEAEDSRAVRLLRFEAKHLNRR